MFWDKMYIAKILLGVSSEGEVKHKSTFQLNDKLDLALLSRDEKFNL
jgi:hypothetical protein